LASFRIYPEPASALYFRVRVFASEAALALYVAADDLARPLPQGTRALCTRWTRDRRLANGRTRLLPDLGEILLTRGAIDAEVISHECTHAAIGWAQRVGLSPFREPHPACASPDEERFCYGVGRLTAQIVTTLTARALLP
jgi:hypothetical protein